MGCFVTVSVLSQTNGGEFSKFLEDNSNLIFSSKDKIHTILPPSLHPGEKSIMTTNHTEAGPIPPHGKHQLGTYRPDTALRWLSGVLSPSLSLSRLSLDAAHSEDECLLQLPDLERWHPIDCSFKHNSTNTPRSVLRDPLIQVFESTGASHLRFSPFVKYSLLQNVEASTVSLKIRPPPKS